MRQSVELEQYLWDASAAAVELDVKTTVELRDRGLILGSEVPLGPSNLCISEKELASSRWFILSCLPAGDAGSACCSLAAGAQQ